MDTPLHALAVPDADRSTLKTSECRSSRDCGSDRRGCARQRTVRLAGDRRSFNDPRQQSDAAAGGCEASRHRRDGAITHRARADIPTLVRAGDVVVANDAATLTCEPHRCPRADRRHRGGAARRTRFAVAQGRDTFYRRRVRCRRLPDADRTPAAPARAAPRRRAAAGSTARDRDRCAGASASDRAAFREPGGGHLGRSGPSRPSDPVRLRSRAAGDLGHVDDESPACRWHSSRPRRDSSSIGV